MAAQAYLHGQVLGQGDVCRLYNSSLRSVFFCVLLRVCPFWLCIMDTHDKEYALALLLLTAFNSSLAACGVRCALRRMVLDSAI